jgi:hypothetical protein
MKVTLLGPFRKWKHIKYIEQYKAQEYIRGCDDTTGNFLKQMKSVQKKIDDLSIKNIEDETRFRNAADKRVERHEEAHNVKCKICRESLEESRQRLVRRQQQLAEKMSKLDQVWLKMYQHAAILIEEHDTILRSSSRITSARNVLVGFKKDIDIIMEEAAPLLSMELSDSSEDKKAEIIIDPIITEAPNAKDSAEEVQMEIDKHSKTPAEGDIS